jgi:hypothetical protein
MDDAILRRMNTRMTTFGFRLLLLAIFVGCTTNQIQIPGDGVSDSGIPDSFVQPDQGLLLDAVPLADQSTVNCASGKVTVTLDRTEYTPEQSKNVAVTVCNGLAETIFLGGCFSPGRLHLVDNAWIDHGSGVACVWEGIGQAFPPNSQQTWSTFFAATSGTAVWKARADYSMGCEKDLPLSQANCTSSDFSDSPLAVIRAPLEENACTLEQACAGNNMLCLAPTDCAPVGIRQPDQCQTDSECQFGTKVNDDVCVADCGVKRCRAGCKADADCGAGKSCLSSGHCAPTSCGGDADCGIHFFCDGGSCARQGCKTDAECLGYCVGGLCHSGAGHCMDCCPP